MPSYSTDDLFNYLNNQPKPKADNEVKSFDINLLINTIGEYQSDIHAWGETVKYANIEYDVTLNDCNVEMTVEVSHDNFNHIVDSYTINLQDGYNIIRLDNLYDTAYVRYKLKLTSQTNNQTPRIHKLIMNVEGQEYFRHDKYLTLDCILIKIQDITYLFDVLMKKGVKRNYLIDYIAKRYNVKQTYILDTLLKTMEDIGFEVDVILQMLGIYRSEIKDWGQTVNHANIEVGTTLNGCVIDLEVEVSDDNFDTVLSSKIYTLSDGEYILDISDVEDARYTRYTIKLKSYNPGYTPRLHYLVMNVEGEGYTSHTEKFTMDMINIRYNDRLSFMYDLIISGVLPTNELHYYLDTIIRNVPDLPYLLDTIVKIRNKEDVDLDILLKNKLLLSYLIDITLQGEGFTKFNIDTILQSTEFKTKDFNLDMLLNKFNIDKDNIIDTLLHKSDLISGFKKDLVCQIINKNNYLTDALLEMEDVSNNFYYDTILRKIGKLYSSYDLDLYLKENNITEQQLLDIVLKLINSTNIDIDTLLKGLNKEDIDLDVLLSESNLQEDYSFDVRLIIVILFIDYAKPRTSTFDFSGEYSSFYNIMNDISSLYDLNTTKNKLFNQTSEISNLCATTNSLGSLYSLVNSIISGFEMNPSCSSIFNLDSSMNNIYSLDSDISNLKLVIDTKTSMYNMLSDYDAAN